MGMNINAVGIAPSRAVSYNQAPAFTGKKAEVENAAVSLNKPSKAKKAAKVAVLLAAATTAAAAFLGGRINKAAGTQFDGNFIMKNAKKMGSNITQGYKAAFKGTVESVQKGIEWVKSLFKKDYLEDFEDNFDNDFSDVAKEVAEKL